MGYLEGFGVTLRQHRLFGGERLTKNYSGGRVARRSWPRRKHERTPDDAAPRRTPVDDDKAPKPERLHGRHVLNRYEDGMEKCIGCELCAGVCPAKCIYVRGADNDVDTPTSPGRALRLRLRDQLPPLHPLRPVRGGLPDRGDHRVQAVRVLVHQPAGRDLHQDRAGRRRRRPAPAPAVGGLARGRGRQTERLDAGDGAVAATPTSSAGSAGAASSATACAPPRSRAVTSRTRTPTLPRAPRCADRFGPRPQRARLDRTERGEAPGRRQRAQRATARSATSRTRAPASRRIDAADRLRHRVGDGARRRARSGRRTGTRCTPRSAWC